LYWVQRSGDLYGHAYNDKNLSVSLCIFRAPLQRVQESGTNCLNKAVSIYRACDAIEGLEEGLRLYDDHNFGLWSNGNAGGETLFASMIITTV
jgi:hypothetical protein